ncbi:uracil-DNA glycosylase [Halobacillus litoralis]|uniref:Uracil-DNA glycosylase n=2 Tax=Halobacillus litoralis TaxID=45668 RepID=A0A845DPM3_9BACI|nr:uracil-DNA glycosylase [Halobacillus halophilus]MYL19356.1 uracil-DNA glycosylase [Halobacillus litoralis]MYL28500.1 uracil-DNA glycosylase [Halobacillus halophilus]MYL38068.1 uracil-DNA glycosylase [Halobacillus litoralis]
MRLFTMKNDWEPLLEQEKKKPYFQQLQEKIAKEYEQKEVFPDLEHVFAAMKGTALADTKVVILGQDPYHNEGQAHGFSFSVLPHVTIPPSLRNIYKELENDLHIPKPEHGCLRAWAAEGVLLLNDVLTVRAHEPHSHKGIGWEKFTDAVIQQVNERERPAVFLLWGKHAQKKGSFIDRERHLVLESPHPSPFAAHRGFFGSRPFSKANDFLKEQGEDPVNWKLPAAPEEA